MGNSMPYSLQQAATATGLNRSTVLRSIKAGKISAVKDEHGEWQIEPAELHRVYAPVEARTKATQRYTTGDDDVHMRAALAEARLADLQALVADLRQERDGWRQVAERLTIADQRRSTVPSVPQRPHWWRRFVG